eukprot:3421582-Pleurochrysis_carterae.AAC.1
MAFFSVSVAGVAEGRRFLNIAPCSHCPHAPPFPLSLYPFSFTAACLRRPSLRRPFFSCGCTGRPPSRVPAAASPSPRASSAASGRSSSSSACG